MMDLKLAGAITSKTELTSFVSDSLCDLDFYTCQPLISDFILEKKRGLAAADMGLGKCGATLYALKALWRQGYREPILVVGPLEVARTTWPDEIELWSFARNFSHCFLRDQADDTDPQKFIHIRRVKYWVAKIEKQQREFSDAKVQHDAMLPGERGYNEAKQALKAAVKELQRSRITLNYGIRALTNPADIHLINWHAVHWLVHFWGKYWPYKVLVYDESDIGLKNGKDAMVWRALSMISNLLDYFIMLSGTPMPEGVQNLWGQMFLIDGGKRLGPNITAFRRKYMLQKASGFGWVPRPGALEEVLDKVKDAMIVVKAKDYYDLPDEIPVAIPVVLSPQAKLQYNELKLEYLLELMDGGEIVADTAGALTQKLMQLANGRVLDKEKKIHELHEHKLDALEEYVRQRQGFSVLLAPWYQADVDAIMKRFPKARMFAGNDTAQMKRDWNSGLIDLMLLHPQSNAHGLNIQHGGRHVLWFGPIFRSSLFIQLNARLGGMRGRGIGPAFIDVLVTKGTIDEYWFKRLKEKGDEEQWALDYLKKLIASVKSGGSEEF